MIGLGSLKANVNVALEADQVDERSYTFGIKLICGKASQRQCWAAAENAFCVNPRPRKIYVLNIGSLFPIDKPFFPWIGNKKFKEVMT